MVWCSVLMQWAVDNDRFPTPSHSMAMTFTSGCISVIIGLNLEVSLLFRLTGPL